MKTIRVVAAIIRKWNRIFTTQRGFGYFKDSWEFPGGKVDDGESPQDALACEFHEELDTEIFVRNYLTMVKYDYPTFHLSMQCFWAELAPNYHMKLLEHEAAKWLNIDNIDTVDWLTSDIKDVEIIKKYISSNLSI